MPRKSFATVVTLSLPLALPAGGEVLIATTNNLSDADANVVLDAGDSQTQAAVRITLPTGYVPTDVGLQLAPNGSNLDAAPAPRVRLFDAGADEPGSPLVTLDPVSDLGTGSGYTTFAVPDTASLTPGSTYWIVVDNTASVGAGEDAGFLWAGFFSQAAEFAGPAAEDDPAYRVWKIDAPFDSEWRAPDDGAEYSFFVAGVIPEPTTLALAAIGGTALLRRRRA